MVLIRQLLSFLLLLWGMPHGNRCLATDQKVWKVQKLYLSDGETISGYLKQQIIGEDSITFMTKDGERRISMTQISKIMSDEDSDDNINRTQREYILTNGDTIKGRYVGEIPGKEIYVDINNNIKTINRDELKEWNLKFTNLELNVPMFDRIVEKRDDDIPENGKKGIIVYQSYNNEVNFLRLLLADGGYETIRIMDIERMEKVENDMYKEVSHDKMTHDIDSCIVNEKKLRFVYKNSFPNEVDVKELRYNKVKYRYDGKIEIRIFGEKVNSERLDIYPLVAAKKRGKNVAKRVNNHIPYDIRYDEYARVSVLTLYLIKELTAYDGNAIVIIDRDINRYLPIQFSSMDN